MNIQKGSSHRKSWPKKFFLFLLVVVVISSILLGSGRMFKTQSALASEAAGGQTVSGPTLLPGMDDQPPADQAVVVDKRNPAWETRYGTQAGLQYLPPRQATFEAPPQGPQPSLGAWKTYDLSQAYTALDVEGVPDGRVFAAVNGHGLRVYTPRATAATPGARSTSVTAWAAKMPPAWHILPESCGCAPATTGSAS